MSKKIASYMMFMTISLLMLTAGAATVSASGGRIPVYAPVTINTPGAYYLTQSVTGDIYILSSDVTLDLNGLAVNGTLTVGGPTVSRVRVTNGKVTTAISCTNAMFVKLDGLAAYSIVFDMNSSNAIVERTSIDSILDLAGTGALVTHNSIKKLIVRGTGHEIAYNTVRNSPDIGVNLNPGSGCKIIFNTISENSTFGIRMGMSSIGNTVTENTVTGNGDSGIKIDTGYGNRITRNLLSENGDSGSSTSAGIQLVNGKSNEISYNTVTFNNMAYGIYLDIDSSFNTISYNTVSQNGTMGTGASGIDVSGVFNVLDWNVCSHNGNPSGGWGININGAGSNILSHNRTPNNSSGGINCPAGNTLVYYDSGSGTPVNPTNF